MDVRWERKRIEPEKSGKGFGLVAVLVEDCQKGSATQQRIIEQLGIIHERFLYSKARDMRAFHQGLFWIHVDKKLDQLTISPEDRNKIELKISETVSRPNDEWALWSVTCIPRYDP
jgi:hypothetical protein